MYIYYSIPPTSHANVCIILCFPNLSMPSTAPTDYVAHINTTVNFEQDVTRATVTVIVEMDGLIEGPEAFSVFLSLPEMLVTRVTLGNITTATVTIFDSDTEGELAARYPRQPLYINVYVIMCIILLYVYLPISFLYKL